ncbi:MAG TPA: hypothetical protein VIU11_27115 [Nakamurella sp.]
MRDPRRSELPGYDEEQVARGFDDWVVAPPAGEHTVRVECDSEAGTSVAEARFTTVVQ